MTLSDFDHLYCYKSDIFYDDWSVIIPNSNGNYFGDCESYALTVREIVEGCRDCKLYGNTVNGVGHVILVDEVSKKWTDCNVVGWYHLGDYPSGYSRPIPITKLGERFMKIKSKIFKLFYREN